MSTKVYIPTPLRQYANNQSVVAVEGNTVGEALNKLTSAFAGLRKHLYNEEGKLRSFVNIYVNEDDFRYLQREETPLAAGDEVRIIPSIAGG